ncbi:Bgt-2141 [Blumeria graminis f. sp. tritici]|uniref:Bgt-2141 n=1 Tax=Blumeria graminis f. sp. tritici TaxID=62690 RepID=A0A9X9MNE7_BLUGR|nr:Bgt-2141 [Blumeria graminis f. sp. tritici]
MSTIYNLEPQPTASCVLNTTAGDISLELWASQLPLTCRNFLQHCLDGYYDNTIFHRLVPNFILQGGDPTGTGNGGESIYDCGFKDEFHSRIKFNRRGLLGMANEGPDSNGSQFFITLDSTPELQGKNTLFGRVAGDTIYNVALIGEAEVGEGERPTYPVKITSVEILVNPFKDMIRRERIAPTVVPPMVTEKKKKKKLKIPLSFGDDEETNFNEPLVKRAKFDSRIVMEAEKNINSRIATKTEKDPDTSSKVPKVSKKIRTEVEPSSPQNIPLSNDLALKNDSKLNGRETTPPESMQKVTSLLERTNAQIAELKASLRRNNQGAPEIVEQKSVFEAMIPVTSERGRKRNSAENAPPSQKSIDILKAFQTKLQQASQPSSLTETRQFSAIQLENNQVTEKITESVTIDEEATLCDLHFISSCQSCSKWETAPIDGVAGIEQDEDLRGTGWMSHTLNFKEDKLGKDLSFKRKAEEELVVIDPREKARTLKEEIRAKRLAKSGDMGREWNSDRPEHLARPLNEKRSK